MLSKPMIRVWRWEDAPLQYREFSPHGGDEDWVAHVPKELVNTYIPWLEVGPFGRCDVSSHTLADGCEVLIGAHA